MAAFNRVIMAGNLTRDPQLSYTPKQTAVVDVGLAVDEKWTDAEGANHEDTCFIDVRAFGRLAENMNKYLRIGSAVLVEGKLKLERWEKNGEHYSKHRLVAQTVTFLDGKPNGHQRQPGEDIPL
jgi:single-strand DNA-binding protein